MAGLSEKISLPSSEGTLKMLAARRALFEGDSQWWLYDFFFCGGVWGREGLVRRCVLNKR